MKLLFTALLTFFALSASSQQVFQETVKAHAHFTEEQRYVFEKDSLVKFTPMTGKVSLNPTTGVLTILGERYILLAGIKADRDDENSIFKQYVALNHRDTCVIILKAPLHPTEYQLMIVVIKKGTYDFYKMDDAIEEEQ